MISFVTHNFFRIKRKEFWFFNNEPVKLAFYNTFVASLVLPNEKASKVEKYTTSVIHLKLPINEIYSGFSNTLKYDLRSAEKFGFKCVTVMNPSNAELEEMVKKYNRFALEKGIRALSLNRINEYNKSNSFVATKVMFDNKELICHFYLHDSHTVILTESFNLNTEINNKRMIGEANKLLHWYDIQFFCNRGLQIYDFGGVNMEKLPGISKFKLSFGGQTVEKYRYIITNKFMNKIKI